MAFNCDNENQSVSKSNEACGSRSKRRKTKIVSGSRGEYTGTNGRTPYVETILFGAKDSPCGPNNDYYKEPPVLHKPRQDVLRDNVSTPGQILVPIPEERASNSSTSSSEQDPLFQYALRSIRRETRNKSMRSDV